MIYGFIVGLFLPPRYRIILGIPKVAYCIFMHKDIF